MSTEGRLMNCLPGKLLVFEGPDGVGKSTLAAKVTDALREHGVNVLALSFPGREPKTLGNMVYGVHHNAFDFGIEHLSPTSLQILHIAAHVDCIENRIIPALSDGKIVILDRYWWSTVAYGMVDDIPLHVLQAMIELENTAWGRVRPERVFLITRKEPFRAELSGDKWSRICEAYGTLVNREKTKYSVEIIDNSKSINIIAKNILSFINSNSAVGDRHNKCRQEVFDYLSNNVDKPKKLKSHWSPTQITEVFNTYWQFAADRQDIFFKQIKSERGPWTEDYILRDYKFTNAYRASDRVSQFLIRHVIYSGDQDVNEVFFRILLFKTFNKIETWDMLRRELGDITWKEYNFRAYDRILTKAQKEKQSIYSAAYIMPSGGHAFGHQVKHRNHLHLIQTMMKDGLSSRVTNAKSMQEVFELLRSYPMIGDFLAYQYAIDLNYSQLTDFSEMSFVVPGPGAKDGIRKCFSDFGGLSEVDLIKLMADRQEAEFARLGIQFNNLWGRPLQLIDCQNLFCEVDKYARLAHPEIKGITGRSRIKQKYKSTPEHIEYFYPPKWKINEYMQLTLSGK